MASQGRVTPLSILSLALALYLNAQFSMGQSIMGQSIVGQSIMGQSINEQKKAVVFVFGTIHPLNPDKTVLTDREGNRVAVEIPLGTAFFVERPDEHRGPGCKVVYLVTAKHVLQDTDGSFLPSVKIRLNLRSPAGDSEFGFISDIPVADPQGNLLWLHSENQADDVVAIPLLPDARDFDFTAIPTKMFVDDRTLNSDQVTEGDDVYFIGLMEQYYGARRNYPLVRRGTLALLTDEDIETPTGRQRVYIAELESWPGNSGSPVFLLPRRDDISVNRNDLGFLGVIVASFTNHVSVPLSKQQTGTLLEGGDKANIGMSCIVPATTIAEILDSVPAQQDRDAAIQMARSVSQ